MSLSGSTTIKCFTKNAVVLITLLLTVLSAKAAEIRAFHNINQLPYKQIYGLPSLDNNPLTESGQWRINVTANISNTFDVSTAGNEQISTDIETLRTCLAISYALRDNWQIGIEVPYIRHSGGFLDNFIYDWHDFFGMPQNGRTESNGDRINISYLSGSGASFSLSDSEANLGDIRINSAFSRPWKKRTLIFSTELKLPTGDFDKLTGSGNVDGSVGLTLNDPISLEKYRVTLFGGLAGIYLGEIDGNLSDIQKNFALAGRVGIGWQASRHIQLKMQVDTQTPLYDSDIKEMGDPALQLVMGGSIFFSDKNYLDISIAEDINTCTAADVAFQLALVLKY